MSNKTWITDVNGNRCSVERWGSKEKAQEALDSLTDCSDCSDCSSCSGCSRCSDCYDCSGCSRCSGCSFCSGCSRCSGCSFCSFCSGCYSCSDCYDCSRCSDCSFCSDCSRCSRCSGVKNAAPVEATAEALVVPIIPDIHKAVYAAASQPKSLAMDSWHTCDKTHCRAGWVVTLAGEAGKKLEDRFDTMLAAMKIYDASDPSFKINPCRFFDDNEEALEDMRKLAEKEDRQTCEQCGKVFEHGQTNASARFDFCSQDCEKAYAPLGLGEMTAGFKLHPTLADGSPLAGMRLGTIKPEQNEPKD